MFICLCLDYDKSPYMVWMNLFCVIFYSDVAYFPLFFIFFIQICLKLLYRMLLCLLSGKSNELKFKLQMHNVLWCMVSLLLCICFFMYIIGCLCNVLYDKAYLKTYHVQFSEQVVLMPFNDFLSLILVTSTCKFYLSSTFQGLERFLLHPTSMRTS
jgi:hypothetical protein